MRATRIGQSRKRWVLATAAFLIATAPVGVRSSSFAGDSSGGASDWKQKIREQEQKEFLREHSDASGKPRPDLWRKGVEQQKQMQVAPYIGWHPSKEAKKSGSTDKQQ